MEGASQGPGPPENSALSYGELGNERIKGYYPYQAVLANNNVVGYTGSTITALSGYAQAAAIVSDITWETTSTVDVGLDLTMLNNRLSVTAGLVLQKDPRHAPAGPHRPDHGTLRPL